MRSDEPDRWCVYRVYDPDTRALLYVGQTCKRKRRMKQHRRESCWFPTRLATWQLENAGLLTYEECPNYWFALIAETIAIQQENPKHNKDRPHSCLAFIEEYQRFIQVSYSPERMGS